MLVERARVVRLSNVPEERSLKVFIGWKTPWNEEHFVRCAERLYAHNILWTEDPAYRPPFSI